MNTNVLNILVFTILQHNFAEYLNIFAFNYITSKVSKTAISEPPAKTGHFFAILTASSSESAESMVYPVVIGFVKTSLIAPLLAIIFESAKLDYQNQQRHLPGPYTNFLNLA